MTVKLTTHHLLNYFQVGACRWRVGKTSATSDVTIHTYTFLETFFPNLRGNFKKNGLDNIWEELRIKGAACGHNNASSGAF